MSAKHSLKGITGFEEQETASVSPWMLSLQDELGEERRAPHWSYSLDQFSFEILDGKQSLWITTSFPRGGRVALRAADCPDGQLSIDEIVQMETGAVGTDMQSQYSPEEQREQIEKREMLRAEDIAACVLYTLTQPRRCEVVNLQIRPHKQLI